MSPSVFWTYHINGEIDGIEIQPVFFPSYGDGYFIAKWDGTCISEPSFKGYWYTKSTARYGEGAKGYVAIPEMNKEKFIKLVVDFPYLIVTRSLVVVHQIHGGHLLGLMTKKTHDLRVFDANYNVMGVIKCGKI